MLRPYLSRVRPYLSRVRPCTGPDPAQFDHMRPDLDAELVQEHLAHRAAGHSGHRFPGARALQDVTRVAMGEPSVSPARTPASHSIWSASIFMRAPRP